MDNSIAAQASIIRIEIRRLEGTRPAHIIISDNGKGMDFDALLQAMRYGVDRQYSSKDLGKYGLGLKTASLSQCRTLTVLSRPRPSQGTRPRWNLLRWSLEHVETTDEWEVIRLDQDALDPWQKEVLNASLIQGYGTSVLWSDLGNPFRLLSSHDLKERDRFLQRLQENVRQHLGMVFHRFIERGLRIECAGRPVEPWNPFCPAEPLTDRLAAFRFELPLSAGTSATIKVSPYVLPRRDQFSSQAAFRAAAGPKGWNAQQGFYFYRNDRLLQAGGWSWLRAPDEHTKLLRIAMDFPKGADGDFSLNVTKMRALIPPTLKPELEDKLDAWIRHARLKYDHKAGGSNPNLKTKPKPENKPRVLSMVTRMGPLAFSLTNTPSSEIGVVSGSSGGFKFLIPLGHPCRAMFEACGEGQTGMKKMCYTFIAVLEALATGKTEISELPLKALSRAILRML